MGRLACVLIGALFGVLVAAVASAQAPAAPAALVLEASGGITPAVRPYTEIVGETTLTLSRGARVAFLHYQTCRTVAVSGGSLTVTTAAYSIAGGTKESDVRSPCPRKVSVRGGGELGGAVFRSMPGRAGVTLQPEASFVLVGPRAGEFSTARITRDDSRIVEGPIQDKVFRWPAGAAPLAPSTAYELVLIPTSTADRSVTVRFSTPATAAPAGQEPLVVIGVD